MSDDIKKQLEGLAPQLAAAKAAVTAADEAHKAAKAAWEREHTDQISELAAKKKALSDLEASARELILQAPELKSDYFGVTRTADEPQIADKDILVQWLIREAPFIARSVLVIDMKALGLLLSDNMTTNAAGERVLTPLFSALPGVTLGTTVKSEIKWTKLAKLVEVKS